MPNLSLSTQSSSVSSPLPGEVLITAAPILAALGWEDLRPAIAAAEALSNEFTQALINAHAAYQKAPNTAQLQHLQTALANVIDILEAEYRRATTLKQEAQARWEKTRKSLSSASYWTQFTGWMTEGLQRLFSSDEESLIQRYENIAKFRQMDIQILTQYQTGLAEASIKEISSKKRFTLQAWYSIKANQLSLSQGDTVTLTPNMLDFTSKLIIPSSAPPPLIVVSEVKHGHFESVSTGGATITQFTKQQIGSGSIRFIHDGSIYAPSYLARVEDSSLSAASINFNLMPSITANQLTIDQGEIVTLNASMLNATDRDNSASQLTFMVNNVSHGWFELSSVPQVSITQFTQQQVNSGLVRFAHDGSNQAPSYQIRVSDGRASTPSAPATIHFNAFPVFVANRLSLNQGERITLTPTPGLFSSKIFLDNLKYFQN